MKRPLVILLHGVGSDGADIGRLAGFWGQSLPGAIFEAPDGPEPMGAGRQWFSVAGVTAQNRPARVAAARPGFDAVLNDILARHHVDDLRGVALVGFSQGAIMALDGLADGRWPVGAVVAFSGRLATPPPLAPATGTPVLLLHGALDPVMPPAESEQAAETLRGLGVRVQCRIIPGLDHAISAEGAAMAGHFLAGCLATNP
ncbi:phospholipase [Rhodovarius crocodyli]|uniref:Phospholipase n=1 Tax=Rhodovarius crocodyli TaxID=1979269 RepID=A0A437LX99_9PROT|nr:dienelactone hydrolase family protein [Rhodovarius crocodyli]RVT90028.1 phospholipase [Rhodovarius crocodyli]